MTVMRDPQSGIVRIAETIFRPYNSSSGQRSDRSAGDRLRHRQKVREAISLPKNSSSAKTIIALSKSRFAELKNTGLSMVIMRPESAREVTKNRSLDKSSVRGKKESNPGSLETSRASITMKPMFASMSLSK